MLHERARVLSLGRMLPALLLGFGVIFVAELGDKSQLMALTYACLLYTSPSPRD